jgi:hypothetical protein
LNLTLGAVDGIYESKRGERFPNDWGIGDGGWGLGDRGLAGRGWRVGDSGWLTCKGVNRPVACAKVQRMSKSRDREEIRWYGDTWARRQKDRELVVGTVRHL